MTQMAAQKSRLHGIPGLILFIPYVLFLLFAPPAVAQESTKDLTELSLEDLMKVEVYSASKHMQSASDAPSSVTVVTADEI
jgi:outer membrane receptor for ferrienterochelin and colicin